MEYQGSAVFISWTNVSQISISFKYLNEGHSNDYSNTQDSRLIKQQKINLEFCHFTTLYVCLSLSIKPPPYHLLVQSNAYLKI